MGRVREGDGGYEITSAGEKRKLKQGETFVRIPGEFHAVGNDGPDALVILDDYPAGKLVMEIAPLPDSIATEATQE